MTCSVDFCVAIPNSLTHYCCLSVSFRTGRGVGLSQTETPYSTLTNEGYVSLNKTLTFCDTTPGFLMKWRLTKQCRNSILMTCHFPNLDSASDWLKQISQVAWPIRSTPQIWVMTCHQYGIFPLVSQTSFCGKTSGGITKYCLLSHARGT